MFNLSPCSIVQFTTLYDITQLTLVAPIAQIQHYA